MNAGLIRYALKVVARTPGRSLALVGGLSIGVGLVVSLLLFVESSSRQLTQTAIAPVAVDMVVHATSATLDEQAALSAFRSQPGIAAAEPLDSVDFASAARSGSPQQKTPPGRIFAIDPSFLTTFDLLASATGGLPADGVLVSDAMASRLGVKPGDVIALDIAALGAPYEVTVRGVVDMSRAEALFLSGDPTREGEFQVLADIVVMNRALFAADLRGRLLATVAPPSSAAGAASAAAPSLPIDQQQYIKVDRNALPANPNDARIQLDGTRRALERQFTGDVKVVNNLGSVLTRARRDVLSAKLLFVFLGLPGVALAIFLARYASELYGEAQRREIGLLRARGASTAQILGMAGISTGIIGIVGSAVGIVLGAVVSIVANRSNVLSDTSAGTYVGLAPWALGAGMLMAVVSAFVPTWLALRQSVTAERRRVRRTEGAPLWRRLWLDVVLLVLAGVVLLVMRVSGGFTPSGTEGQAVSLSFYLFLAPLFLWIGLTLFLQRLLLRLIPRAAGFVAGRVGGMGRVVARSMSWRAERMSSAITVIALTLSFGLSLGLFTSTYAAERRAGSHYVVGSDVRVTPALGSVQDPNLEQKLKVPGAAAVSGVARDTRALVGSERKTAYGIDVATFRDTAYLPDSFVVGGDAQGALAMLGSTPDGVIVNREEALKFNILVGDPVLVRLSTVAGGVADVRLRAVAIVKYFPTSSQDSDFIMNRSLMMATRNATADDFYLVRADGTEAGAASVSARLGPLFGTTTPARIDDLRSAVKVDESSLTSLNLGGLDRIERVFTLLIAVVGFGMFLLTAMSERSKEYSTMRALGAAPGQIRTLVIADGLAIMVVGLMLSAPAGVLIAMVLTTLLTSIFLLPVGGLAVSMTGILVLGGAVVGALAVALAGASFAVSRFDVGSALREE